MIHQGIPKISDFGAGKEIGVTTSHKNDIMGAICYLDPQRCGDQEWNENYKLQKPSDIYSLGVIFWQIFSGRNPFKDDKRSMDAVHLMDLFEQISRGKREIAVQDTPKSFIQLYETCWHSDPKTRLTILEVVKRCKEIVENAVDNGIFSVEFFISIQHMILIMLYYSSY